MTIRTEGLKTLALLSMLLSGQALAHGGHKHLKGTVKAISERSITIDTVEKTEAKVQVDDATTFEQGDTKATLKDLKVGERVVVHAMKRGDALVASDVKFSADAPAAPAADKAPAKVNAPKAAP